MRGDEEEGRVEKRRITGTREMLGARIKREVDYKHLVFEADYVGWLLCYHIILIQPLLFIGELRRERDRGKERRRETAGGSVWEGRGHSLRNQHANNITSLNNQIWGRKYANR